MQLEVLNKSEPRIRLAPPITARELLGRRIVDAKGLSLTESPMNMFRVDRAGTSSREYGAVVGEKIDGRGLISFLNEIAPIKGFQKQDVLSDWELFERAEAKLFERHLGALGEHWIAFGQSRQVLTDTLALDPNLYSKKTAQDLVGLMGMDYDAINRFCRSVLAPDGPRELQEPFLSAIADFRLYRHRKWVQEATPEQLRKRVAEYYWDHHAYTGLPVNLMVQALASKDHRLQEVTAAYCNSAIGPGSKAVEIVDTDVFLRFGKTTKGKVRLTPTWHGKKVWELEPETVISTNYLLPTIRWSKDANGERKWILDFLDESLVKACSRFANHRPEDLEFDRERFNPLVGMAIVPYFIPELRKDWPKYQAFFNGQVVEVESHEKGNFMAAGQVFVLASQKKDASLTSDYFPAAEAHIEKYAA